MTWKVITRSRAKADLRHIRDWYEKQSDGLGDQFLSTFDESIVKLQRNPHVCQLFYKRFRQLLTPVFPYRVLYAIHDETVVIYRVLHSAQDHTKHLN